MRAMTKSFDKGERLGHLPPCAICMGPGEGDRAKLTLPGGVTVWLCAAHRSEEFQRRRAGRDFVASLSAVWDAAGCMTVRRRRALDANRRRFLVGPPRRDRPGSYAWSTLRAEAEERWAAGEEPRSVIDALRERAAEGAAAPPSRPTMHRWYQEGRWR